MQRREEDPGQYPEKQQFHEFKVEKAEQAERLRRGAREAGGRLGESRVMARPQEERLVGSRDLLL